MSAPLAIDAHWNKTDYIKPNHDQTVLAMDSSGHMQKLKFHLGLWFLPDLSMRLYFTPPYWKALS